MATKQKRRKKPITREARRVKARAGWNREKWLSEAVGIYRGWFERVEKSIKEQMLAEGTPEAREAAKKFRCKLPKDVRVTCGWPSQRGTAKQGKVIGECWSPKVSGKGYTEIMITPWLDGEDAVRVLDVLLHECIHAGVGNEAGHGPLFVVVAKELGLEGKPTATIAGEELAKRIQKMIETRLGGYPHSKLNYEEYLRPVDKPKKRKTYFIKCECPECGYIVRTTQKWLDTAGAPVCPTCEIPFEVK
jgi:hypothetical protein